MHKYSTILALIVSLTPQIVRAQPQPGAPGDVPPTGPDAPVAQPDATPSEAAPAEQPAVVEAPPEQSAANVAAVQPEAPVEEVKSPKNDRLDVGDEGFFKPGAMIQGWFFLSHQGDTTETTFRVRRAELSAQGELVPKLIGYKLMIDPAKTLKFGTTDAPVVDSAGEPVTPDAQVEVTTPPSDTSILQDVYVTFMSDYVDVSIGQFKIPVSYEGSNSSSKLLFPERALTSKAFGDRRDVGLRLEKEFEHFGYVFGVFNGTGLNRIDDNNQKDLGLRLEAYPIEKMMIGVVGYTSVGSRDEAGTKDRVEGDFRAELGDALVQAEYIHGWDGPKGARLEGQGVYVAGGYTFFERLQPIVRVGMLDSDVDSDDTETNHYEFGFNYYLRGHNLKLQTSFSLFDPSAPGAPTRDELIVSTQLKF